MADDFNPKIHVRIRVHKETLESALMKRIDTLEKGMLSDDVKRRAAEIFIDCVEPLVPMSENGGNLRRSAHVAEKKYKGDYAVIYNVPYAKAQYKGAVGKAHNPVLHWTTPGTHDHWNKHMTTADRAAFYDLVKEEIMEKLHHG